MNTKLAIALSVAALSLATTAFAGEGHGAPALSQTHAIFDNTTLPENGQNGPVQTANSLPRGFENGTAAYMTAQSVNRWYAQQADHRFAEAATAPRG